MTKQKSATHPNASLKAFRGSIYHCLSDPGNDGSIDNAVEYFEDGILLVKDGLVEALGPADELISQLPTDLAIKDHRGHLIMPGFIDSHIHYAQTDVIASHGAQLLDWLNKYTFPAELKFKNKQLAEQSAEFFLDELLRNGTTSAMVMPTSHVESVDALFSASQNRNMRMICGKVLMDRHAPEDLLDTAETGYHHSRELIEQWHHCDRLQYAITPRFAPTSSDEQLAAAGRLAKEYPDTYIHSHVAENKEEIEWVKKLFPWSRSYLDVYDHFGLLRERALYAHGIYLNQQDRLRLQRSGAALAFCPSSNTFLGSGLFNLTQAREDQIRVGLASDVGGGTSFSMLKTLSEAYKVQRLAGNTLSPSRGIYLATLGSAEALYLEDKIGNFTAGKEADFIILDYKATPLIERRIACADTIDEKLFVLMILGDDRLINATYIMGECLYTKS